jgi:hypothetical protein
MKKDDYQRRQPDFFLAGDFLALVDFLAVLRLTTFFFFAFAILFLLKDEVAHILNQKEDFCEFSK